jgi:hypothetical protein
MALGDDELRLILQELDVDVLLQLRRVCRCWRRCIDSIASSWMILSPPEPRYNWIFSAETRDWMASTSNGFMEWQVPPPEERFSWPEEPISRLESYSGPYCDIIFFAEGATGQFYFAVVFECALAIFNGAGRVVQLVPLPAGLLGVQCRADGDFGCLLVECFACRSQVPILLMYRYPAWIEGVGPMSHAMSS